MKPAQTAFLQQQTDQLMWQAADARQQVPESSVAGEEGADKPVGGVVAGSRGPQAPASSAAASSASGTSTCHRQTFFASFVGSILLTLTDCWLHTIPKPCKALKPPLSITVNHLEGM